MDQTIDTSRRVETDPQLVLLRRIDELERRLDRQGRQVEDLLGEIDGLSAALRSQRRWDARS